VIDLKELCPNNSQNNQQLTWHKRNSKEKEKELVPESPVILLKKITRLSEKARLTKRGILHILCALLKLKFYF
jgi:hypothetical protein